MVVIIIGELQYLRWHSARKRDEYKCNIGPTAPAPDVAGITHTQMQIGIAPAIIIPLSVTADAIKQLRSSTSSHQLYTSYDIPSKPPFIMSPTQLRSRRQQPSIESRQKLSMT